MVMPVDAPRIEHFTMVEDLRAMVYIAAAIAVAFNAYAAYRLYVRAFGSDGLLNALREVGLRRLLSNVTSLIILQSRVLKGPGGVYHALIFYGMAWLFIATVLRFLDYKLVGFLVGNTFKAYKLFGQSPNS
jgi:hypothetical protein